MEDSTKRYNNDLRFLLKDKYKFTEIEVDNFDEDSTTPEIKSDVEELKSGHPLDYIIGYKDFLGLKINLNYKPLIPRPETEYWTEKIINSIDKQTPLKVLDIFCGSGCIGLALLRNFPNATCTFADINSDYLLQTKQNADINFIDQERFELIRSNVFSGLKNEKFDLIVANPPYVSKHIEPDESIKHEPKYAIFARKNGLELIDIFLQNALEHLNDEGRIFLEFGEDQKDEIDEFLRKYEFNKWDFYKDQFGKWRWVEAE